MKKLVLTIVLAATTSAFISSASADSKGVSPMGCRPLTAADAVGLVWDARGIINSATENRRVICAIPRDQESAYSAEAAALVSPWFETGSIAGSLNCSVYRGSAVADPYQITSAASGTVAANTEQVVPINITSSPDGWYQLNTNLVCTLSPKVTLAHIYVEENGTTN